MEKSIEYPSKNDPLEGETHERESLSPRFLCFPSSLTLIQTPDLLPSPSPLLFFVVSSSPFSMPLAMLGMSPRLLCSDNDLCSHHSQPFRLNFMGPRTPLAQIYLTSPSLVTAAKVYWPLFVGRFVGRCCVHRQIQHVRSKGFSSTLRQGNITHHEYIQVGKGRDVGLNQIALYEGKVTGGNGEQVLSRLTV
ncbi:hypothetical protein Cgig2_019210 [Carnegiea gigantea]|uniref:Glycosyl transferase 48 domain-containing protein n=1 Tax=Carnegiea gigantea TaxID=171969 RepID=A0A9Q1JPP7_9CARY|nr:hypothetical protein Cgig2_019210 [Carnegiea gigantea]